MNARATVRGALASMTITVAVVLLSLSIASPPGEIVESHTDDNASSTDGPEGNPLPFLAAPANKGLTLSNINISNQPGNQSEVSLVINPTDPDNIVVVGNVPGGGIGSFYSFDGGLTWNYTPLDDTVDGATHTNKRVDPTVCFDDDGNVYASYFTYFDPVAVRELFVAKSFDGGATWPQCELVQADAGIDKEMIGAGPDPFDPDRQNVYLAYRLLVGNDRECRLAASYDGGLTWPTNVVINDQSIARDDSTQFAMPAVGPGGELYVVWDDFIDRDVVDGGYSHIMMDASFDGGLTWGTDVLIDRTDVSWNHANGHAPSQATRYHINAQPDRGVLAVPSIAVDRSGGSYHGRIYVAYTVEGWAGTGDLDVVLRSSDDHGATWSAQTQVIDELAFSSQFLPWMSVDNCSGGEGRVVVGWLDTRLDPLNRYADAFMAVSDDGGASFGRNRRISEAWSDQSTLNPDRNISNYLEYIGVDICANVAHMVWPGNHHDPADQDYFTDRFDVVNDFGDVYVWNGGAGDWHTATNWTPANVPGQDDWAVVASGAPRLAVDASIWMLELQGGTIEGPGILAVLDSMEWSGGSLTGDGALVIDAGAGLNITAAVVLDRDLVNDGTIYWRADGDLQLDTVTTLTNNGLFLDETTTDVNLHWHYGYQPFFQNNGIYRKMGPSVTTVIPAFVNDGTVRVHEGEFYLYQGDGRVDTGDYRVHPGAELHIRCVANYRDLDGAVTGGGTVRFTGNGYNNAIAIGDTFDITGQVFFEAGTHSVKAGSIPVDFGRRQMYVNARVAFDSGRNVAVDSLHVAGAYQSSALSGADEIHVGTHFLWTGGALNGTATFFVDDGALAEIDGYARFGGHLTNNGAVHWLRGTIEPRITGVFENNGVFRDMTTADELLLGNSFVNNLSYVKETGTLTTAQIAFLNSAAGAVSGIGRMDFTDLDNQGMVSPGIADQPGLLTVGGGYPTASTTWTKFDVAGYTPEVEYDVLEVDGEASLGGTLLVVVDPGFTPLHLDSFTFIRCSSRVGEFDEIVTSSKAGCDFFTAAYTDTTVTLVYQSLGGSPPVAALDEAETLRDTACDIRPLDNDTDPDGGDLAIEWLGEALHGVASLVGDTLVAYTPDSGYVGADSLQYEVRDDQGCLSGKQWIVIDVLDPAPVDGPPAATLALGQNYPNPANPLTTIAYSVSREGPVRLEVFDVMGRRVAKLVDRMQTPGTHRRSFDASGLASGVYLYRLLTAEGSLSRRMTIVK